MFPNRAFRRGLWTALLLPLVLASPSRALVIDDFEIDQGPYIVDGTGTEPPDRIYHSDLFGGSRAFSTVIMWPLPASGRIEVADGVLRPGVPGLSWGWDGEGTPPAGVDLTEGGTHDAIEILFREVPPLLVAGLVAIAPDGSYQVVAAEAIGHNPFDPTSDPSTRAVLPFRPASDLTDVVILTLQVDRILPGVVEIESIATTVPEARVGALLGFALLAGVIGLFWRRRS